MQITKNFKYLLCVFCIGGFISNLALAGTEAVGEDGTAYYFINQDPSYFYVTPKLGWDITNSGNWEDLTNFSQVFGPLTQPEKNANSYIVGIAGGYKFAGFPFRIDVNYFFINDRKYDFSPIYQNYSAGSSGTADIDSHVFLLNVYYDWYTSKPLTPYIGVGAGEYFNKTDFSTADPNNSAGAIVQRNTTNGLAWDIVLGLRYDFNPNWALNLEGNYIALNKATANETFNFNGVTTIIPFASSDNLKTFNVLLGLTYKIN